jgi:nucleoside-triphosphatase THEP1
MIRIICGGRDAGKTRRVIALYRLTRCGDGLCMPKSFSANGAFLGYDLMRLSSGEARPLARRAGAAPPGWDAGARIGDFAFSAAGLALAAEIVDGLIACGASPVYLDEIGPLELRGEGFAPLLRRLLAAGRDLVITVRTGLLAEVTRAFSLEGAEVMRLRRTGL